MSLFKKKDEAAPEPVPAPEEPKPEVKAEEKKHRCKVCGNTDTEPV